MKILKDTRKQNGYITAIINGRWVMAKVYDEPSEYGVNECRVSKLCIGKSASRDKQANFLDQMAYNYDRGLDFDNLADPTVLPKILAELNNLPEAFA